MVDTSCFATSWFHALGDGIAFEFLELPAVSSWLAWLKSLDKSGNSSNFCIHILFTRCNLLFWLFMREAIRMCLMEVLCLKVWATIIYFLRDFLWTTGVKPSSDGRFGGKLRRGQSEEEMWLVCESGGMLWNPSRHLFSKMMANLISLPILASTSFNYTIIKWKTEDVKERRHFIIHIR